MRWSASVVWSKMKQFNSELLNHNSWLERTPECYKQFFVGMQVSAIITWKNDMVCLYICSFSPSMLIPSQATVFFFLNSFWEKIMKKLLHPQLYLYTAAAMVFQNNEIKTCKKESQLKEMKKQLIWHKCPTLFPSGRQSPLLSISLIRVLRWQDSELSTIPLNLGEDAGEAPN